MILSLASFRQWACSNEFPRTGRIDWMAGEVDVDLSPEDITTHGTLKGAISRELGILIETTDRGIVLIDSARLADDRADLSAEPDVLVVLQESVEAGHVRLIPKAGGPEGRFIEIEGAADLVVECVSDSSVEKDRDLLPALYFRAGVREYWLADARGPAVSLLLFGRGPDAFAPVGPDTDGFRRSAVLGCRVRLVRIPLRAGLVRYQLETR